MTLVAVLLVAALSPLAAQDPPRGDPGQPSTRPAYRQPAKGEAVVEGLLQRVDCRTGRPVRFTLRVKEAAERFEAVRLEDVDYIAHTPDFKGPMTCGGRGQGDPVRLTWKKEGATRRVVAIEFLPTK